MPIPNSPPCECDLCECHERADGPDELCYECRIGLHVEDNSWLDEYRQEDDLPFQ